MPAAPIVPDSQHEGLVASLPPRPRALVLLARLDRPIGWQLLFWPCAWGVALPGGLVDHWRLVLAMLVGAIAMRGAGCVYNDIVDRDLDARVARTAARPLPAGMIGVRGAWAWLVALSLVGFAVLLMLPPLAALVAVASLGPVAAYPFMKRITWWPQAWLGLVFTWGALVGWTIVEGALPAAALALYAGGVFWTIGYDTIYALQDIEDDAMVGVRSSARALGARVRPGVGGAYAAAVCCWGLAIWLVRPDPLALLALLPAAIHLGVQVRRVRADDPAGALRLFRSNRFTGLLVFLGTATVGLAL